MSLPRSILDLNLDLSPFLKFYFLVPEASKLDLHLNEVYFLNGLHKY